MNFSIAEMAFYSLMIGGAFVCAILPILVLP